MSLPSYKKTISGCSGIQGLGEHRDIFILSVQLPIATPGSEDYSPQAEVLLSPLPSGLLRDDHLSIGRYSRSKSYSSSRAITFHRANVLTANVHRVRS